jgi:hypothetical protein
MSYSSVHRGLNSYQRDYPKTAVFEEIGLVFVVPATAQILKGIAGWRILRVARSGRGE